MTAEQAIRDLAKKLAENAFVEYYCDLCDGWTTRDPNEALAHYKLMNAGKSKSSQWYHVIEARKA